MIVAPAEYEADVWVDGLGLRLIRRDDSPADPGTDVFEYYNRGLGDGVGPFIIVVDDKRFVSL